MNGRREDDDRFKSRRARSDGLFGLGQVTGSMFDRATRIDRTDEYKATRKKLPSVRCPDCGKKITIVPCVSCEIRRKSVPSD